MILKTGLLCSLFTVLFGCSEPPVPSEVQQAMSLEKDLWRAGAAVYAPTEYQDYLSALQASRDLLIREQARLLWFRDYQPVTIAFQEVITRGNQTMALAKASKAKEETEINTQIDEVAQRIKGLRELSETIKDRRLAMRRLMQAEIRLEQARALYKTGKTKEARELLREANVDAVIVTKVIKPLLERYADRGQIARWRQLYCDTVEQSRRSGGYAIVVDKLDRELILFRGGNRYKTYQAGLGFNFLSDKLYSGDRATPEGKYRVIRKLNASRYYRALLIDYPNAEDQARFAQAKRRNQIPKSAHIGGLIEIHGGGSEGMTYGCVSLSDRDVQELYNMVDVGTPVTIVGSVENDNIVCASLKLLN